MGDKFIKIKAQELKIITITCPHCGAGIQIDLSGKIYKQLASNRCVCGEMIPKALKTLITEYGTALSILEDQQYDVTFELPADN